MKTLSEIKDEMRSSVMEKLPRSYAHSYQIQALVDTVVATMAEQFAELHSLIEDLKPPAQDDRDLSLSRSSEE